MLALVGAAMIAVAGALDGRYLASLNSKPAYFARIDVLLVVVATIAAALVVAFIAGRLASASGRLPARGLRIAILGLVAISVGVGYATAAATGGLDRPPVVLEAVAKAAGLMPDVEGFTSGGDAPALCHSVADGTSVAEVAASDLGSLTGYRLRGTLQVPDPGASIRGEVFVDAGTLPPDSTQPIWTGRLTANEVAADGRSGVLAFAELALETDPPAGLRPDGQPWPSTLRGTIRWTCGEWMAPGAVAS